jgi:hypothetical protein
MMEEMGLLIDPRPVLWRSVQRPDRMEHVFYANLDLDPATTPLHEGQRIAFFPYAQILKMDLGFQDGQTLSEWMREKFKNLEG